MTTAAFGYAAGVGYRASLDTVVGCTPWARRSRRYRRASFTVNGAPIPHDSAITTAGARFLFSSDWIRAAKFDGDFADSGPRGLPHQ